MDTEQIQRLQKEQSQGHPMVETGMQFLSKFILSLDFRLSINLIENWLHDKSRMNWEIHVRFWERFGVQFPLPTRLDFRAFIINFVTLKKML
jgi:hypothetical protein